MDKGFCQEQDSEMVSTVSIVYGTWLLLCKLRLTPSFNPADYDAIMRTMKHAVDKNGN